jgi:hypothetical protein
MATPPLADRLFDLPGGLASDGRPAGRAELRPLTGRQEEWLAAEPAIPTAPAVTRLLADCLVRVGDTPGDAALARRLLVGDRDFLMLQLRRITLGDAVRAVARCPACAAPMDVDFSLAGVPADRRPQAAAAATVDHGGRTLRFRLPCGADQEAVVGLDPVAAADAIFRRCLLDDGGTPPSADDRAAVAAAMDRLAPQFDLDMDLTCPECGHGFAAPFDLPAYFLQEVRVSAAQLIRETHLLAFHYHWSEAEILGLGRDRRRAYLALLSDELAPR